MILARIIGWFALSIIAAIAFLSLPAAQAAPAPRTGTAHNCGFQVFDSGSHSSCAFSAAVSAGDFLYSCAEIYESHTVTGVSDDVNGAWTLAEGPASSASAADKSYCYFFANSAAGTPTVTWTENSTGADNNIKVIAYSGVATSSTKIASSHSDNLSGTALTCASASATGANQLLVGYIAADGFPDIAPANGETERLDGADSSQLEDKLTSGSGSVAPQWSFSPTDTGSCITAIFDAATTGGFDTSPSVTSKTALKFTVGGSLASSGTVSAVACKAGTATPTIAEIVATHCTGGSSSSASGSQSPNAAPYDFSFDLTTSESPAFPIYDLYVTDGTTRVAIGTSYLSPPSTCGENADQLCQFVSLASVAIGGIASIADLAYDAQTANFVGGDTVTGATSGAACQIISDTDAGSTGTLRCWISSGTFQDNEIITGAAYGSATVNGTASYLYAANDVLVAPTYVSPGGSGVALTIAANGNASYVSGSERETALNIKVYDYSARSYAAGDIDFVNNDVPPNCIGGTKVVVLLVNSAMPAFDLDNFCSSFHADALSSIEIGALPTGISLNGATNVTSGTPTVENESGVTIKYIVADTYGAIGVKDVLFIPLVTLPLTDCTTSQTTQADCVANISLLFSNAITISFSDSQPSASVPLGYVLAQNPVAGTETAPYSIVTLTISSGPGLAPNCLGDTVNECVAEAANVSVTATVNASTGCSSGSSVIYSQSPAVASQVSAGFQMTVFCR